MNLKGLWKIQGALIRISRSEVEEYFSYPKKIYVICDFDIVSGSWDDFRDSSRVLPVMPRQGIGLRVIEVLSSKAMMVRVFDPEWDTEFTDRDWPCAFSEEAEKMLSPT